MVGRICREKKQALLLDAAEYLDDPNIRFLVAGGVPPESPAESAYLEALVARVNTSPLRGRVEFLGNRADVAALMKASDVVVLASENESFGRVLLEALSLGIPVIAPGRGGPAEILGNGERGTLFEAGSAKSLASAINKTLGDPKGQRATAERGRKWVLNECAPRQHTERIQAVWKEVAANPKMRG
jgi:glycosyltransferase involved in cell wall biosynthesis